MNEKRPLAGALSEAYAPPRPHEDDGSLANTADYTGHTPSASVASATRGGVSCDDEAMRLRRTVGVGYRARCVATHKRKNTQ